MQPRQIRRAEQQVEKIEQQIEQERSNKLNKKSEATS